ncbi:rod shape-determining protein MreC [Rubritalea squalenifaciens DSM 18772]|uniref:Cell shape-determining protein MreC n=2 Tax=Rubritalea TaxID=361050 RepID=A0A1M6LCH7_9BACT|nr:rod shape-determining protein MreC [Rubritalea squalenifaciens]SHJ68864.1 rod shape-determining protein MreC [Rubritalea squalenifaciens DSM 18772]
MKPLNLITLLLFLAGAAWALTRSEEGVRQIQRGYYATIGPFLKSGAELETKAREFTKEVEHSEALNAKLEQAEAELVKLRTEVSHLRQLEDENIQLRAALRFQQRSPFSVTAAKIIRRKPATWWQTITIDRGQKHNVGVQLPVLAAEGLVGKVDRPDDETSTVILLTDEKCQVSARIEGTQEVGILSGQRAQYGSTPVLRLRYLSKEAKIKPGAKVVTTGRGGLFPANIELGTVTSFEAGSFDAEAQVKPAVDFAALETVFVLTGHQ